MSCVENVSASLRQRYFFPLPCWRLDSEAARQWLKEFWNLVQLKTLRVPQIYLNAHFYHHTSGKTFNSMSKVLSESLHFQGIICIHGQLVVAKGQSLSDLWTRGYKTLWPRTDSQVLSRAPRCSEGSPV